MMSWLKHVQLFLSLYLIVLSTDEKVLKLHKNGKSLLLTILIQTS